MELKDFVASALTQIAKGIEIADNELKETSAIINPKNVNLNHSANADGYGFLVSNPEKEKYRKVEKIDFDVAVTVSEGSESKGGIGIVVGAIGLGSQGRSEVGSSATSRIKFSVPIVLPNGSNEI